MKNSRSDIAWLMTWFLCVGVIGGSMSSCMRKIAPTKEELAPAPLPEPPASPDLSESSADISPGNSQLPIFSPDGQKILFCSDRKVAGSPQGEKTGLYLMNADGTNVKRLPTNINSGYYAIGQFCWAPDSRKIAFTPGVGDIYIIDADGKNLQALTNKEGHPYYWPTWSPDGKSLAYAARLKQDNAPMEIWVTDVSSRQSRKLATGSIPAWSPDSKQLAFWSGSGVMTVDADGKNQRLAIGADKQPILARRSIGCLYWAPDGKNVFFDGGGGISIVNVENGDYRTSYGGYSSSLSPDGKQIVFTERDTIWKAEAEKREKGRSITSGTRMDMSASWSPDGKKIVFVRDIGKYDLEIWVMDPDGANQKQLTFSTKAAKVKEAQKK